MSTKKKFTPEEIRHLRANPYTQHVTESTITYTLAFKEAFWQLSLEGAIPDRRHSESWDTIRKSSVLTGFITLRNDSERPVKQWKGFMETDRVAFAPKASRMTRRQSLMKQPDGCSGRLCACSSKWRS